MQSKRIAEYRYNDFTCKLYFEKIKVVPQGIYDSVIRQDEMIGLYMKNEPKASHVADLLDHIINTSVTLLKTSDSNFKDILNVPSRDPSMFFKIVNQNPDFVKSIFENYMIKVNLALENKVWLHSAKICGKITNNCLYYFDDIFTSKDIRQNTMNYIKGHLNLLFMCIMRFCVHYFHNFKSANSN